MWPGRFSHYCFGRGRLLRILPVFAENSAPGRVLQYTAFYRRLLFVKNVKSRVIYGRKRRNGRINRTTRLANVVLLAEQVNYINVTFTTSSHCWCNSQLLIAVCFFYLYEICKAFGVSSSTAPPPPHYRPQYDTRTCCTPSCSALRGSSVDAQAFQRRGFQGDDNVAAGGQRKTVTDVPPPRPAPTRLWPALLKLKV